MTRIRILAAAALAVVGLALAVPAAAIAAGGHGDQPRPGAACSTVGATTTIDTEAGEQVYRCEQRQGDPCPVWHWAYNAGVPKGQHRPHRCPVCPSASTSASASGSPSAPSSGSPSASRSASAPASAPASPSTSASTPALAVTGSPAGSIAGVGLVLTAAGGGLVWLFRRRRAGAAT